MAIADFGIVDCRLRVSIDDCVGWTVTGNLQFDHSNLQIDHSNLQIANLNLQIDNLNLAIGNLKVSSHQSAIRNRLC